jgi:hypothetical protein
MAPAKKPRGRKPKAKNEVVVEDIQEEVKKPITRRGRKPNKTQEVLESLDEKTKKGDKKKEFEELSEIKKTIKPKDKVNLESDDKLDNVLAQITKNVEEVLQQEKMEEESLPKKKGRKPKNKIFDYKPEEDEPKKRGRKPKEKYGVGVNEPVIKEEPPKKSEDYIILNLPIKSKDLKDVEFTGDSIVTYNQEIMPDPKSYSPKNTYEELENDKELVNLNNIHNLPPSVPSPLEKNITKFVKEKPNPVDYTKQDLQRRFENIKERKSSSENCHNRHIRLMIQFTESGKRNEWPQSTKIYCFWCSHPFDSIPWGIPFKYINNVFHVDGNFCSPECAAAYNFDQKDFNMWERYALLNLLYNKINYPSYRKVKLAPQRRLLVEYGGSMSIEEFRSHCQNYSKDYIINFPPMVSIPTMAEEVNLSEHFRQKVVYMDPKRIDEASRRCQEQEKELMEHGESLHNCFKRIANLT